MGDSSSSMGGIMNAAGSISGNIGSYYSNQTNSVIAEANAKVAAAHSQAAKAKAYGQASKLDTQNRVAGTVAAENMARLARNKTHANAGVNAARGSSGFTKQGSGGQANVSVLTQFKQAAQDMAYSRSLQDQSARYNASILRHSGNIGMMSAEAEADYLRAQAALYDQFSSNAKTAAITTAVATAVGAAVGGTAGAQFGGSMAAQANSGIAGTYESQTGVKKNQVDSIDNFFFNEKGVGGSVSTKNGLFSWFTS